MPFPIGVGYPRHRPHRLVADWEEQARIQRPEVQVVRRITANGSVIRLPSGTTTSIHPTLLPGDSGDHPESLTDGMSRQVKVVSVSDAQPPARRTSSSVRSTPDPLPSGP